MKTFLAALVMVAMALPFAACSDVSHTETSHRNWDGSTTHKDTTVVEHPNGTVSVDETKVRTR